MSKNLRKIIFMLSVVYVLSIGLVCSGIALAGGISCFKIFLSWVVFAFGFIILILAKVSPSYANFITLFQKKESSS